MSGDIEDIIPNKKRSAHQFSTSSDGAPLHKSIKLEPGDINEEDVIDQITNVLSSQPDGVSDTMLQTMLPNMPVNIRAKAINSLLSGKRIELFTKKKKDSKELVYKLRSDDVTTNLKDATVKEEIVYEIIRQSGNKGIWHRDIRARSNLMIQEITKIIKALETKDVIKSIKHAKKKLYMLTHLEPDSSVTCTSVWFDSDEFDAEFVQVVTQQCYRYLQQKTKAAATCFNRNPLKFQQLAAASAADICQYLIKLGLTKVEIAPGDLEKLLDALVLEGKVEKRVACKTMSSSKTSDVFYMLTPEKLDDQTKDVSPCIRCPVARNCRSVGRISPSTCPYLSNIWNYCDECVDESICPHLSNIIQKK